MNAETRIVFKLITMKALRGLVPGSMVRMFVRIPAQVAAGKRGLARQAGHRVAPSPRALMIAS